MYDVYVKNDYFYNKGYSQGGNELDLSVDDYMRKIQNAIPELKDVSISDVSIHWSGYNIWYKQPTISTS